MSIPTYEDVLEAKKLTQEERYADLWKLMQYDSSEHKRKFCGNAYLYHYQIQNLTNTAGKKSPSFRQAMETDPAKIYAETVARKRTSGSMALRMFECYRVNHAPVVFFKPSTAKWIYEKFGATSVLDPTAGWGGRMLGAWALRIKYTGIDTNMELQDAYYEMMGELDEFVESDLTMLWTSWDNVDFSTIDYDCVLTSPPYINLELYEHMTPFASDAAYYDTFLIPLILKCIVHCKPGGWVCFNISPKMFKALMDRGFRAPTEEHSLLQQLNKGKDKQDKIYCWKC